MRKISVFDTTISDYNLGNQIIMESIYQNLQSLFPDDFFFKLPYMEIKSHTVDYLKRSDLKFFGGTNALSGEMERYKQWDLNLVNSRRIKDVILMGVGWWQYQDKLSLYTKIILRNVLSKRYLHSVRDSHTQHQLGRVGITNVINTGCPTMWRLTNDHCSSIPLKKSGAVILTFTDYNKNLDRDRTIFSVLKRNYGQVYYWIQGEGDWDYVKQVSGGSNVTLISPNLHSFDKMLEDADVDYVGTRLHAGIRALQKQRRALIIGIDNRAIEMHKDFGLPVLHQRDINELEDWVHRESPIKLQLPVDNIFKWKTQFIDHEKPN